MCLRFYLRRANNLLVAKTKHEALRDWLERERRTQDWLAGELEISTPFMSQIVSGKRVPSLPLALEIERITGISPRDLMAVAS